MTTGTLGQLVAQPAQGGQAVALGHADVHEHDLRSVPLGEADGFVAVGGFGHDLNVADVGEQAFEPGSDHFVVVGDKQADGHGRGASLGPGALELRPRQQRRRRPLRADRRVYTPTRRRRTHVALAPQRRGLRSSGRKVDGRDTAARSGGRRRPHATAAGAGGLR